MDSNDSFSSNLNMVIEPGQDMSAYGPGVGGGDGDLPGGGANNGNNLQPAPDGTLLSSQQQQGGSIPPINTGDPTHGGHPRFPTTQTPIFMSSRKFRKNYILVRTRG